MTIGSISYYSINNVKDWLVRFSIVSIILSFIPKMHPKFNILRNLVFVFISIFTIVSFSYSIEPLFATLIEENDGFAYNEYAKNQRGVAYSTNYEIDSSNSFVQTSTTDVGDQPSYSATTNEINTFEDSKTKVSFQYPSDWEIASDEYVDSIFGDLEGVIVLMLPKSLDGSSMSIIYEKLPFSMSAKEYVKLVKKNLLEEKASLSDAIPVSMGSVDGYKYNVTISDETFTDGDFVQTQIVFVKNSKAFVIAYSLGATDMTENLVDIETMLDSIEIGKAAKDDNQIDDTDGSSNDVELDSDKVGDLLTFVFNSLFPETGEKFTNTNYGVDIMFPKNWTGFEMKVIFPMAVVSPEGFNITGIFSTVIDANVDTIAEGIVSDNISELSEQKKQELTQSVSNKLIEDIQNKTATMAIFIYDKEFFRLMNSMNPNSTASVDSLTSIYEQLAASDPAFNCERETLEYVTLNNNISAEMSTEECLFTDSNKKHENLNYFVLIPNAIVGIQYTSDPNKENDEFLSEFEEALKTLSIEESLPINNQTIQQFLNG